MATSWYYAHDDKKLGPFSQLELKHLAAAGTLLPIDTVWIEGNETGVLASQVKNLFMPVATPPEEAAPPPILVPLVEAKPTPKERPKAKGRAAAISGADIVSQDGEYARYRMKCVKCGHKDSSCHTIPITNRFYKASYFCPKCRKRCEVAVQCHS
jgi:hypothetical protein